MTPLYNHTSMETAYLVDDYPYGRKVRCRIRYWIESHPKKGFRFCSQTEHPFKLIWNAPKKSTYIEFAACMFLDEKGYVQWHGVGQYSEAEKVLAFVKDFRGADLSLLRSFAPMKVVYLGGMISGRVFFTIGGVKQENSDIEVLQWGKEKALWEEAIAEMGEP